MGGTATRWEGLGRRIDAEAVRSERLGVADSMSRADGLPAIWSRSVTWKTPPTCRWEYRVFGVGCHLAELIVGLRGGTTRETTPQERNGTSTNSTATSATSATSGEAPFVTHRSARSTRPSTASPTPLATSRRPAPTSLSNVSRSRTISASCWTRRTRSRPRMAMTTTFRFKVNGVVNDCAGDTDVAARAWPSLPPTGSLESRRGVRHSAIVRSTSALLSGIGHGHGHGHEKSSRHMESVVHCYGLAYRGGPAWPRVG